jgi:hypothetical protein
VIHPRSWCRWSSGAPRPLCLNQDFPWSSPVADFAVLPYAANPKRFVRFRIGTGGYQNGRSGVQSISASPRFKICLISSSEGHISWKLFHNPLRFSKAHPSGAINGCISNVLLSAPEAQRSLAPRFTGVPKKRSLFLGVEAWGTRTVQMNPGVPQGRRKDISFAGINNARDFPGSLASRLKPCPFKTRL